MPGKCDSIPAVLAGSDWAFYDVAPDGESFVVVRTLSQRTIVPVLVENWWLEFEED